MKAIIRLDVPDWQIGQEVSIYFPDTMMKKGRCEEDKAAGLALALEQSNATNEYLLQQLTERPLIIRCQDCGWNSGNAKHPYCQIYSIPRDVNWFCADGRLRDETD